MGFSAKQVQAVRRHLSTRHIRTPRPMAANCPISRAGTPSRKPTGFSDLMVGTGRRPSLAVCLPARTAGPSWRSTSLGSESPFMRMVQSSYGKAMAPVKATEHRRAKCTISRSRPRKPMLPSAPLQRSGGRSGWRCMGVVRRHCLPKH
jgi:hypothetical protein